MSNDALKATIDVLREQSIEPTINRGKHLKIEFEVDGAPRTIYARRSQSGAERPRRGKAHILRAPVGLEPVAMPPAAPEPVEAPRVRQAPHAPRPKDNSKTSFISGSPEPARPKPARIESPPRSKPEAQDEFERAWEDRHGLAA